MKPHVSCGAMIIGALLTTGAHAASFDLRDASVETVDDRQIFALTADGIVATLAAGVLNPTGVPTAIELNRTVNGFGVNLTGSGFGVEDSDNIDGDQGEEFVRINFDRPVRIVGMTFSSLGSADTGSITVDGLAPVPFSAANPLPLPGSAPGMHPTTTLQVDFEAGNGFSFDNFTVVPVPAPLAVMGAGGIAAAWALITAGRCIGSPRNCEID